MINDLLDTSVTVNECIPQSIENAQLNCQTSSEAESQPCVGIIEISDSTVKADTLLKVVNDGLSTSPLSTSRRNEDVYCSTFQTPTQAIQQDLFDNHKSELIKSIIEIYLNLRLFHETKCATDVRQKEYIRHKYKKLIHFKHQ